MIVRCAKNDDVSEIVNVVRLSITELCVSEYRDDPEVLQRWLSNKTDASFQRWIADEQHQVFVGERLSSIIAVGMITSVGEIQLNYVLPRARFQGVSKALMHAMEQYAQGIGLREFRLLSTQVASRMYHSMGYEAAGEAASQFGTLPGILMRKALSAAT